MMKILKFTSTHYAQSNLDIFVNKIFYILFEIVKHTRFNYLKCMKNKLEYNLLL